MRPPRSAFVRILSVALLLLAVSVRAEETRARVDALTFGKSADGRLTVSFGVTDTADSKLVETVDSGLPVRFVFRVRLARAGVAFGASLSDRQFERVLEKDNLKNRYRITDGSRFSDYPTFEEAVVRMGRVDNFPLAQVAQIPPDQGYRVEVQVKLEEFRLPFHLHRILPFMNFWDVTTPWLYVPVPAEALRK